LRFFLFSVCRLHLIILKEGKYEKDAKTSSPVNHLRTKERERRRIEIV